MIRISKSLSAYYKIRYFRSSLPEVFLKRRSKKFCEIHRKTPVLESLFYYSCSRSLLPQTCNFIKKGTLAQVFPGEFCEIFQNTFFYRTPPVTASDISLFHNYYYGEFINHQAFRSLSEVSFTSCGFNNLCNF